MHHVDVREVSSLVLSTSIRVPGFTLSSLARNRSVRSVGENTSVVTTVVLVTQHGGVTGWDLAHVTCQLVQIHPQIICYIVVLKVLKLIFEPKGHVIR